MATSEPRINTNWSFYIGLLQKQIVLKLSYNKPTILLELKVTMHIRSVQLERGVRRNCAWVRSGDLKKHWLLFVALFVFDLLYRKFIEI